MNKMLGIAMLFLLWAAVVFGQVTPGGFVQDQGTVPQHAKLTAGQIAAFMPTSRGAFTFPLPYGTRGVRLTEPSDCGGGDCVWYVGYSYWMNMNNHVANPDILIFLGLNNSRGGIGPTLFSFNKTTEILTKVGSLFTGGSPFANYTGEGWYFSYTQATKMYIHDFTKFYRHDVLTKVSTQIFDVTAQFPGKKMWQHHSSVNDNVHSMTVGTIDVNGVRTPEGCAVYVESTTTWHWFPKFATTYDECNLDKGGNWIIILELTGSTTYNRFILLSTHAETLITGGTTTSSPPTLGHLDTGYGYMIGADNTNALPNATRYYTLGPPVVAGPVVHYNPNFNIVAMQHVAHSNALNGGPMAAQMACGSDVSTQPYPNDITCVRLDTTAKQMIVAPVMTNLTASGGGGSYEKQPKGNLDVTGGYFLWTSNLGTSRMDAFLVKVPKQLLLGGDATAPATPSGFAIN